MFAWLVQSVSDPVTAVMDQIAARGRSVPLPESRSKSRPLRQIEFPLAKPLAHHEK
jgi:hypothetical protein